MTGPAAERLENYREDVAGRANVEDTADLKAYYKDLERYEAAALWTVANKIEPWEPKSSSVPVLWRYEDLREPVLRIGVNDEVVEVAEDVLHLVRTNRSCTAQCLA